MALAIFDLDNTLISGDSDYLWGEFLIQKQLVATEWFRLKNQKFLEQYNSGNLIISEWLAFQLKPLTQHSMGKLHQLRNEFIKTMIEPLILPKALKTITMHKNNKDTLIILSATNYFITKPIADLFKINTLIATKPEIINNKYTGKTTGTITFQEGKIVALNQWLNDKKFTKTYFYSDSHNDIPLLEYVDIAIAVDPDEILRSVAVKKNWQIVSFR